MGTKQDEIVEKERVTLEKDRRENTNERCDNCSGRDAALRRVVILSMSVASRTCAHPGQGVGAHGWTTMSPVYRVRVESGSEPRGRKTEAGTAQSASENGEANGRGDKLQGSPNVAVSLSCLSLPALRLPRLWLIRTTLRPPQTHLLPRNPGI